MPSAVAHMENRSLFIALSGSIDSSNSQMIEQEILAATEKGGFDELVLDCEHLDYITSAGLRVILRLSRTQPEVGLINVSSEVYDVLDVTGFTQLVHVTKAYRTISVEGCEVIGQGANGKVCRLDPETVVKVYLRPDALPNIHRERELARLAFVAGVPTAIPYDVVRIEGGGYGSVFELLNARSFAKVLINGEKSLDEVIRMSVDLLKTIHSRTLPPGAMPNMPDLALGWVDDVREHLTDDQAARLRELILAMPDDLHIIHGDYHIKNIELQGDEAILIDMDTLARGDPVFEFVGIYDAYCGFSLADHGIVERFLGIPYDTAAYVWSRTLALYLGTEDEARLREKEAKVKVLAGLRIIRHAMRHGQDDPERAQAEIRMSRDMLAEFLPQVDSLAF